MKILFDTNILLDVFLRRDPFFKASSQLVAQSEAGKIEGWICATTITTIHYLIGNALNRTSANQHVENVLKIFRVAEVNRIVLNNALNLDFIDYEDAALYQSAFQTNLNGILTRNKQDFESSDLPVYTPDQLLIIIQNT